MALYIPHNIFHLARLLYVRPETFGPYYVYSFTNTHVLYHILVSWALEKLQSKEQCHSTDVAVIFKDISRPVVRKTV